MRNILLAALPVAALSGYGTDLVLDGSHEIDESVYYANVTISASVPAGKTLHMADGGKIIIDAAGLDVKCPIVMGDGTTHAAVTLQSFSGKEAYLNGVISGPTDIQKTGDGTVHLNAANTFDGNLEVAAGHVYANSDGAFGSTVGKTICKTKANSNGKPSIRFWSSLTTSEKFDIYSHNDTGRGLMFHGGNRTYVLNGDMNLNGGRSDWDIPRDTTVTINGSITNGATWGTASENLYTVVNWNGPFHKTSNWYFLKGRHNLRGHITGTNTSFYPRGGDYHFLTENVFTMRQEVHQENSDTLTFSLEGCDQACKKMGFSHPGDEAWDTFTITSASGNAWHVEEGMSAIAAAFTGNAGLSCEGGTQYILKSNTSTGVLTVTNGATVVMLKAGETFSGNTKNGAWAGDVVIAANSRLRLATAYSLASSSSVSLDGVLEIPTGCSTAVAELWVGGVRQPGGVYGAPGVSGIDHELENLAGTATLTVANWQKTNLTITGDYTVAAEGVMIDGTLTVNGAATVTGGRITLANGAILDVNASVMFENAFEMGRAVNGEAISIDVVSGKTAVFNGVISGVGKIETIGGGEVYFCGDNTFDGNLELMAGTFYPKSDNAMGSAKGWTRCNGNVTGAPKIRFQGITTDEPLQLADRSHQPDRIAFYGTNTFNGPVDICHAILQSWNFTSKSKTVFNGGFTNSASCHWYGLAMNNSNVEICWNSPTSVGGNWYFAGGRQYFSSSVSFSGWRPRGINTSSETVLVWQEGASLASTFYRQEDANLLAYDLVGADIAFTHFANYAETDSKGRSCALNAGTVFRSATGRTVSLTQANATGQKFYGRFEGDVNLSLTGAGSSLTLGGENSSTGTLSVANGARVAFAPDAQHSEIGTWSGDVVITGGSRVTVSENVSLYSKRSVITIAGEGSVLDISGATVTCAEAVVDGVSLTPGRYSAGSPGVGSHLSGTGALYVRGVNPGLMIFVR